MFNINNIFSHVHQNDKRSKFCPRRFGLAHTAHSRYEKNCSQIERNFKNFKKA